MCVSSPAPTEQPPRKRSGKRDCGVDSQIWREALQAMPTEGDGTGHRPMPKLSGTGTDG